MAKGVCTQCGRAVWKELNGEKQIRERGRGRGRKRAWEELDGEIEEGEPPPLSEP